LFDFAYAIDVDFGALSRQRLPNLFIDMFGDALDWKWVLRSSLVNGDLMKKYAATIDACLARY